MFEPESLDVLELLGIAEFSEERSEYFEPFFNGQGHLYREAREIENCRHIKIPIPFRQSFGELHKVVSPRAVITLQPDARVQPR